MKPKGTVQIDRWRRYLDDFVPSERHRHEAYALHACRLAVDAASVGTHGVGAVLFDAHGKVLVEGHNKVHHGGFRSDLHAEMVVMNEYEAAGWPRDKARGCTLVTSLEPCPMCMTRMIVAGLGTVLYVSHDAIGGMVQRKHGLPPTFRSIMQSENQVWGPAECSQELRSAALKIWAESRASLGQWLPGGQDPIRTPVTA